MPNLTESIVEDAALTWLAGIGYSIAHGPEIAPGEPGAERDNFAEPFLPERLREALERLNPTVPAEALGEAYRHVTRIDTPQPLDANHAFHTYLTDGVPVDYLRADGTTAHDLVRLVDFESAAANDFLAVNQFAVIEGRANRRPDIVLFVNGLPLAVIELKNAADEGATIWSAFRQLQTYKQQISALFTFNEVLVVSDGLEARVGTLSADRERFMPWRTIDGTALAPSALTELEVLLRGVFEPQRFLDLLRHFVVFEDDGRGASVKKMDRRAGVVWHTQGSGKSLTMAFYAGRVVVEPPMANPTLVVLTDRNDLDDQLFATFSRCHELLRQVPVQAKDRTDLRAKLQVASGGVVFTTIQKFFPEERGDRHPLLSDRRNIVVIADEAHRSQYDFIDGFAKHLRDALPNASFIGFTGTPIEFDDRSTPAVFGDYIDTYTSGRPSRTARRCRSSTRPGSRRSQLSDDEKPKIDDQFEELTEDEEEPTREKLKTTWAKLEALVGTPKRLGLVAADVLDHWDRRVEILDGKAMIVCMSAASAWTCTTRSSACAPSGTAPTTSRAPSRSS
jgi:type I restriction enzyme R subunit